MFKKWIMISCVLFICLGSTGVGFADITALTQPTSGPGGSDYLYTSVSSEILGVAPLGVKIYEPPGMEGEELPVIVFLHGYFFFQIGPVYVDFIEHLVKKGYIVIYPFYQSALTPAGKYTNNVADQINMALDHILTNPSDHAQPLYIGSEMQFGMVGHSTGGIMAGNLAAKWNDPEYDVPRPLAICAMNIQNGNVPIEWIGDAFDADTDILVIVGEDDTRINEAESGFDPVDSKVFWDNCTSITNSRKDWILLKTDDHGYPDDYDLNADHRAATNVDMELDPSLNNLDYYGYWKWATALMNYSLRQQTDDYVYAFGNSDEQRDLGKWSDEQPVTEPEISDGYE